MSTELIQIFQLRKWFVRFNIARLIDEVSAYDHEGVAHFARLRLDAKEIKEKRGELPDVSALHEQRPYEEWKKHPISFQETKELAKAIEKYPSTV